MVPHGLLLAQHWEEHWRWLSSLELWHGGCIRKESADERTQEVSNNSLRLNETCSDLLSVHALMTIYFTPLGPVAVLRVKAGW